jgi:hypothetical protein
MMIQFNNHSLITRIAIGKGVGLIFGAIGFVFLAYAMPEVGSLFHWGVLFWYTTVGAVIGVFGVFTYHPILKLPMPWWVRSSMIGAWMNLVLTLFIYDDLAVIMLHFFGENGLLSSPFWFVLEGGIIGLIIGYLATRFGGEGKDIVDA